LVDGDLSIRIKRLGIQITWWKNAKHFYHNYYMDAMGGKKNTFLF